MTNRKPENQPDKDDTSVSIDPDPDASNTAPDRRRLKEEEEAARLGDFA